MAIVIQRLMEKHGTKVLAEVLHSDAELVAFVSGTEESLQQHIGSECLVELDYGRVIDWKEIPGFQDETSCIKGCTSQPNSTTVRGRVHNVMDISDQKSIIDIYIQSGPEFLSVESEELKNWVPAVGTGLEITVENLCFYPTNT